MRSFVTSTFAVALALVPVAALAQTPATTAQQPPAGQQPPAAAAQPAPPAAPKIAYATPAGVLLVQIKPDKTAVFEEMAGKLQAGLAKTTDETLKKQSAGLKIYKSTEPFGPNALYVILIDPAVASTEYDLFQMLAKTMTDEEKQKPETAEMWKRYIDAFAAGLSKLSLTPLAAGGL
jgi:hypothetical protein